LPGSPLVLVADLHDDAALSASVARAEAELGRLDGVIVGNLTPSEALLPLAVARSGDFTVPLAAVASRLTALGRALAGRDLRFALLTSSLAALSPRPGHALAAAAAAIVDA